MSGPNGTDGMTGDHRRFHTVFHRASPQHVKEPRNASVGKWQKPPAAGHCNCLTNQLASVVCIASMLWNNNDGAGQRIEVPK